MKTFNIVIEVDDNITLEEIEDAITEMVNNLPTSECFYAVEETADK